MRRYPLIIRLFLLAVVLLVLALAVLSALYLIYGSDLKQAMFEGRSISFLNNLIAQDYKVTFDQFSQRVDEIFWVRIVLGFPLTLIFLAGCIILLKQLFGVIGDSPVPQTPIDSRERMWGLIVAFLVYGIATILFFYPCLGSVSTAIIGPPEDNMQHQWGTWWGYEALFHHAGSLTETKMIFYPEGVSLYYHAYTFYNLFLSFLLRQFMTVIAAYNLLMLHTFLFAGIGAYLLIRYLTRSTWLALVGGFIFAFNPWHFVRALHHLNIASIQFIPFFALYFIKSIRGGRKRDLLLATLFFVLNSLCSWNYLIILLFFMGFAYIYLAIRRQEIWLTDVVIKIAVVSVGCLIALSPWLGPMILVGLKHPGISAGGHAWMVGDLCGFIVPGRYHWLGKVGIIERINESYTGNVWETTVYLGLGALAIIAASYRRIAGAIAKYVVGFFSFVILTMGAHIHVCGETVPVSLPYRFIAYIPFLTNMRVPARNVVLVYLFLGVILTIALKHIFDSAKSRRQGILLVSVLSLLVFADYFSVCHDNYVPKLPACYRSIEPTTETFGILDLPSGYGETNRYMLYQTYHHFPIVQGWASRKLSETLIDSLELEDIGKQKAQLTAAKVKYVIIHKDLVTPGRPPNLDQYQDWYRLHYEDDNAIVWKVY